MISEKKIIRRIQELTGQIGEHNKRYHDKQSPVISDFEYDVLVKELEYLEKEFPHLIRTDSPTLSVGADPSPTFQKIRHHEPMISLSNAYSFHESVDFDARIRNQLSKEIGTVPTLDYFCELKIDGLAISLRYQEGKLLRGVTRGDGQVGEEVSANIREILDIPRFIPFKGSVEIRGEVYMERNELHRINAERLLEGDTPFANTRNASAGSLRQLDPTIVARRRLRFFAYSIVHAMELGPNTQSELFELLHSWAITINPHASLCGNLEAVQAYIQKWEQDRSGLPYEIDGVVVKLNPLSYQDLVGNTAKSPRWAMAYKFIAEEAKTVLKNVFFQVGRLGTITPVALIDPVKISGATISRATLHNKDFILEKGIGLNDEIIIKRAGEVIPEVVMVAHKPANSIPISFPERCPSCDSLLVESDELVAVVCPNESCPGRVKAQILHVVSRDALNMEGMGEKLVDQLLVAGIVREWTDLFSLSPQKLSSLERTGEKSIANILSQIEKAKQQPLSNVLFALGIKFIGEKSAQQIATHISDVRDLFRMTKEDFEKIEGIGQKSAQELFNFFAAPTSQELIHALIDLGFTLQSDSKRLSQKLQGKIFVVTGTLEHFSRKEIEELIQSHSGKVAGTVSKLTSFVVAGTSAGSKLDKAQTLGVPVITEDEFREMVK